MRILALDQSSKITGWCIFEDQQLKQYGKFDCGNADLPERLTEIRHTIKKIIEDFQINAIYIEDIQLQNNVVNNVATYKALAEVIGVISQLAYELKIPQTLVSSSTWKSKLGIRGRNRAEQKRNAQQWVVDKFSIKPTQDECDSICIGYYSCNKKEDYNWTD